MIEDRLARTQREITELLAEAGARAILQAGWRELLGHDCKDVMKGLVLGFQADGRRPPIAALQEFAQLISNRDDRFPALLDEAEQRAG